MYALAIENISDLLDNDPRIGPAFVGTETHAVLGQIPTATIHYKVDDTLKARVHLSEPEPGHVVARYAIGGEDHFVQRTNESESMGSFTARVLDFAGNRAVRGLDAPDAIKSVIPILRAKFAKEYTHVEREPFYFDNSAHFGDAPRGKGSLQPNDVLVVCPDASRPGVGFARISLGEIQTEIAIDAGDMEKVVLDTTSPQFKSTFETQLDNLMRPQAAHIMCGGSLTPQWLLEQVRELEAKPYTEFHVTKALTRKHDNGFKTTFMVETPMGEASVWYDETHEDFNPDEYSYDEYRDYEPIERTMGANGYSVGVGRNYSFDGAFLQMIQNSVYRGHDVRDLDHDEVSKIHKHIGNLAIAVTGRCLEISDVEHTDVGTATRTVFTIEDIKHRFQAGIESDSYRTHIFGINNDGEIFNTENGNERDIEYETGWNVGSIAESLEKVLMTMEYLRVDSPRLHTKQNVLDISDLASEDTQQL